jgi:nicotinate-nucleotide pyrophosphorylase (carboxylating)
MFTKRTKFFLKEALKEDIGRGDITSRLLIPHSAKGTAFIFSRESGIFCGAPVLDDLFHAVDRKLKVRFLLPEGKKFFRNQKVAEIRGRIRSLLAAERTALNFLGHLSGIATQTHRLVQKVKERNVCILDTRKTTPLWRELDKYAVKTGGGKNHRMGLYNAVFVKENHRRFGDLKKLKKIPGNFEIEVRNLREAREAVLLNPRVILFDNFSPSALKQAAGWVGRRRPEIILEASGGVTLENIRQFAASGVDWISAGFLTHSVKAANFSLLIR